MYITCKDLVFLCEEVYGSFNFYYYEANVIRTALGSHKYFKTTGDVSPSHSCSALWSKEPVHIKVVFSALRYEEQIFVLERE